MICPSCHRPEDLHKHNLVKQVHHWPRIMCDKGPDPKAAPIVWWARSKDGRPVAGWGVASAAQERGDGRE